MSSNLPDPTDPTSHRPRRVTHWLDHHTHPDSRLRRYLEFFHAVIALLGVGGLLALVWQINATNTAADRAAYDQIVDSVTQLTLLQLDYPDLVCVLYPDAGNVVNRLDRNHEVALQFLILSTNAHERFWRLHRDGLVNEEDWLAQDRWFRAGIVGSAPYPAVWAENRAFHASAFAAYVDELVAAESARRTRAALEAGGTPVVPTLDQMEAAEERAGTLPPSC